MGTSVAARRVGVYWSVAVLCASGFVLVGKGEWRSPADLHVALEAAATVLALVVGSIALVRYYSHREAAILFIATAFLAAGLLDGYHALEDAIHPAGAAPSATGTLASWSGFAARLFLSVGMWLAWLGWHRDWALRPGARVNETHVYAIGVMLTIGCFLFFAFMPLPPAYYPALPLARPADLVPGAFFLLALAGFLRKGDWRHHPLDHWIVLSLVVGIFGQLAFMALPHDVHDPMFDLAHTAKVASYLCVLTGLMIDMYGTFRSAAEGHARFRNAIGAMTEGFALYDADDRLVAWNDRYASLHNYAGEIVREGMPFEEMVRGNVGRVAAARGREEEYIEQRLARHRDPSGPLLLQVGADRWFLLTESRTPEGGTVVNVRDISDLKRIEAQVAEKSTLLQGTIDAMAAMISVWDRDMRLLAWNESFGATFGDAEPLRLGMSVKEIFLNNARRGDYGDGDPERLAEARYQASLDLGWNRPFEIKVGGRILEMTRYRLDGIGHVTAHRDVTERRRIEAELAEKSTLIEATFDAMDDALSVWDADSRLLASNRTFEQMMSGPAGAPWIGMHLRDMFLLNARNGVYGEGEPEALADERYEARMAAIHDPASQFVTFAGRGSYEILRNWMPDGRRVTIHRNITDRVVAEERLSHVVENLSESFALWDAEDRLVLGNRRFRELNGAVPEAIRPGIRFEDHVRAIVQAGLVPQAKENPGQWLGRRLHEHRHPGKVQEVQRQGQQWFLVHEQRLPGGSIALIAADITEVKRAELRVREREQRLRTIVDNVVDGIVTFDQRGFILSANPAVARIFRCSAEEIVDRQVGELFAFDSTEEIPAFARIVGQRFDTIGEIRELNGCRSDGTVFPMEVAVTEVTAGRDSFYVCILRDISARHEMDRMKSEFVSTVSHELRTPLTSIRGSLGLVVAGAVGALPEPARELVEIAERNANRLIGLVNDILDMEKIESGRMEYHFEDCPVAELVARSLADNKGFADGFGVTFTLVDRAPGAVVRADRVRMAQVLANLLSNAAKFSPRDGTVDIRIEPRDLALRISVSDRGPGIPEGFRSRVFEKFTQVDSSDTRKVGGTGLGLSITRAIVERHGGTIDFDSKVGEGATFFFDIPYTAVEEPEPEDKPAILVCEDDFDIARLIGIMLQRNGYAVSTARTAAEATGLLAGRKFAAMTVDLMLPDENGIALVRELRNHPAYRSLPIVVLSAAVDEVPDEIRTTCVEVVDWLVKPIDERKLAAAIGEAVRRSRAGVVRVLHVEDDADIVRLVRRLVPAEVELEAARDLRSARRKLQRGPFDLVILDVALGDGSGLDLLPVLKSNGHAATPVLLFSGREIDGTIADQVAAALVKSRTTNEELLSMIQSLIKSD